MVDNGIREARLAAGLTTRQLGERAGTSHSTIIAYEKGRKIPRWDTRNRLIEAAGFTPLTILGRRRVEINDRGTTRGVELKDVLDLADAYPAPPRRSMDRRIFPQRLPA